MPQAYAASSARIPREPTIKTMRLASAGRSSREPRLCDGYANASAPEPKPSKCDRRNSPAHVYNKAGQATATLTMTALAAGSIAVSIARSIPIFSFIAIMAYRKQMRNGRLLFGLQALVFVSRATSSNIGFA
jgi:hypothetical protein